MYDASFRFAACCAHSVLLALAGLMCFCKLGPLKQTPCCQDTELERAILGGLQPAERSMQTRHPAFFKKASVCTTMSTCKISILEASEKMLMSLMMAFSLIPKWRRTSGQLGTSVSQKLTVFQSWATLLAWKRLIGSCRGTW